MTANQQIIEAELTHTWEGEPLTEPRKIYVMITDSKVEVMTGAYSESRADQGVILEVDRDETLTGYLYRAGQEDPIAKETLEEK